MVARSRAGCAATVGRILRLAQSGLCERGRIELEGLHRTIATITQAIEATGEALVAIEPFHHVRGGLGTRNEVHGTRSGITRNTARITILPRSIDCPLNGTPASLKNASPSFMAPPLAGCIATT